MLLRKSAVPVEEPSALTWRTRIQSWLLSSWEIYLIVLVAGFLRLYRINTTEFDGDQADIFRMAHDAVSHGLQVATSNVASIQIFNPPGIIYLLMIPAAFSADPLWAAVMVAMLAVVSVLLTYWLTRRYYGRLAATFAALLYATALLPVFYSRFIWQQNLLLFFVPLFIITLFWGAVARRKGWLFPALLLLGLLFQLHGSGAMMAAPLLVALLLSPGTVRWRDLIFGAASLLLIYGSYLIWEVYSRFHDITILLNTTKLPVQIDNLALLFYQQFLSPYSAPFAGPRSLLSQLIPFVSWAGVVMTVLLIAAGVLALVQGLWSGKRVGQVERQKHTLMASWATLHRWWTELRATPYRCGLLILFVWQAIPLLYLSRHSINLFPHYFIVFMPGPFILIGLLLAKMMEWGKQWPQRAIWKQSVRLGIATLAVLIIVAQFAATTANVLDLARGNFLDHNLSTPYYNDLNSLQQALSKADQVAQQRHLKRIYISAEFATENAFSYLSQQLRTPTTVFNDACLVLPGSAQGPALLLVGPYNNFPATLATQFAGASLIDQPKRLSGAPFQLYLVQPALASSASHMTLGQDLQLLDTQSLQFESKPWLVSRWNLLRSQPLAYRTTYTYNIKNMSDTTDKTNQQKRCVFTSIQAGDQLVTGFQLLNNDQASLNVQIQSFTTTPYIISPKPLKPLSLSFLTDNYQDSSRQTLKTADGKETVTLSASSS